jgi:hypothetical protein
LRTGIHQSTIEINTQNLKHDAGESRQQVNSPFKSRTKNDPLTAKKPFTSSIAEKQHKLERSAKKPVLNNRLQELANEVALRKDRMFSSKSPSKKSQ